MIGEFTVFLSPCLVDLTSAWLSSSQRLLRRFPNGPEVESARICYDQHVAQLMTAVEHVDDLNIGFHRNILVISGRWKWKMGFKNQISTLK